MKSNKKFNELMESVDKIKDRSKVLKDELKIASEYKEDSIIKLGFAEDQIKKKQIEYFNCLSDLRVEICRLKIFIDTEYLDK